MLPASSNPALPTVCSICHLPHHQPFSDLDPLALADFDSRVTSMEIEPLGDADSSSIDWVQLLNEGMATLGIQRVEHYVAPSWPEGPVLNNCI